MSQAVDNMRWHVSHICYHHMAQVREIEVSFVRALVATNIWTQQMEQNRNNRSNTKRQQQRLWQWLVEWKNNTIWYFNGCASHVVIGSITHSLRMMMMMIVMVRSLSGRRYYYYMIQHNKLCNGMKKDACYDIIDLYIFIYIYWYKILNNNYEFINCLCTCGTKGISQNIPEFSLLNRVGLYLCRWAIFAARRRKLRRVGGKN